MNSKAGNKKFFLVYKITNLLEDKIYVGVHVTYNVNDAYMGSSKYLKIDIRKFGKQNFKKEILYVFDTKEEMLAKEKEIVTRDFCMRVDTYNRIEGGNMYNTIGMASVKDKNGNRMRVYKNDPRYLSGELVHITTGITPVKDIDGHIFCVSIDDPRFLSGELISFKKGTVPVKDMDGNKFVVSTKDDRYLSGELVPVNLGRKQHQNSSWQGRKHNELTKQKIGEANSNQKGNKNSQYGTCWIYNVAKKENKKIKLSDLQSYMDIGWIKGRKIFK